MKLEIDYDLDVEEMYDLLTEVFEEGYSDYWATNVSCLRDSNGKIFEWVLIDEDENKHTLTSSSIERGIKRLFKPDFKIDNEILRSIIAKDFSGECLDSIIQAASLGELIYG
jgi:hypothetical protein